MKDDSLLDILKIAIETTNAKTAIIRHDNLVVSYGAMNFGVVIPLGGLSETLVIEDVLDSSSQFSCIKDFGYRFLACIPMDEISALYIIDDKVRIMSISQQRSLEALARLANTHLHTRIDLDKIAFLFSHVIRRPLANVLGLASIIKEGYDEVVLDMLVGEVREMDKVITEIVSFT